MSDEIGEGFPVECDGELEGFLSLKNTPCDENKVIGVFTTVCDYVSWIGNIMVWNIDIKVLK